MRYHTTFRDIAVSLLIVLSCAVLSVYGMVHFDLGNPSRILADFLLGRLDRHGEVALTVGSVDRRILGDLSASDVSVTVEDRPVLTVSSIHGEGGMVKFLGTLFPKAEPNRFSLTFEHPSLSVTERDLATLLSLDKEREGAIFGAAFLKNRLSLHFDALDAHLMTDELQMETKGGTFDLELDPNAVLHSWNGSFPSLVVSDRSGREYGFFGIGTVLSDTGVLSVKADKATVHADEGYLEASDIDVQANVEEADIDLSYSLQQIEATTNGISLVVPQLGGTLSFASRCPRSMEMAVDSLDASKDGDTLHLPTSAVHIRFEDGGMFRFRTSEKLPAVLDHGGLGISAMGIDATAWFDMASSYRFRAGFDTLRIAEDSYDLLFDKGSLSGTTSRTSDRFDTMRMDIVSDAVLQMRESDIDVSGHLSASVSLIDLLKKQSVTLSLQEMKSNLIEGTMEGNIAYQDDGEEQRQVQLDLGAGQRFSLSALYDRIGNDDSSLTMRIRLDDLPMQTLDTVAHRYAPFLQPFYGDASRVTGNISFFGTQGDGQFLGYDGPLSLDLALQHLQIGNKVLDAGTVLNAQIVSDRAAVSSLSLTTSGYRLAFSGDIGLGNWLPSGQLVLSDATDGSLVGTADFALSGPHEYRYHVTTPLAPSFDLSGVATRTTKEDVQGTALVAVDPLSYSLSYALSFADLHLHVASSDMLVSDISFAPPLSLRLVADDLPIPTIAGRSGMSFSGSLTASWDNVSKWSLSGDRLSLTGLNIGEVPHVVSMDVSASPSAIDFSPIVIDDGNRSVNGYVRYHGTDIAKNISRDFSLPFVFAARFSDGTDPLLRISLIGRDNRLEAALKADGLPLGWLVPDLAAYRLDASLVGFSDLHSVIDADGLVSIVGIDDSDAAFFATLSAHDNILSLDDGLFTMGDTSLANLHVALNAAAGRIDADGHFSSVRHLSYRDRESRFSFSLHSLFDGGRTLFDFGDIVADYRSKPAEATLSLEDVQILGEPGFGSGSYQLAYDDSVLSVYGDLLSLRYDFASDAIAMHVDPDFGFGFDVDGTMGRDRLSLVMERIHFPLPLLNRFFTKPIFAFLSGDVKGDLLIEGTPRDFHPYGQLSIDDVSMTTFWVPDDVLRVKNLVATFDGERLISPRSPFFATNGTTGQIVEGWMKLEFGFDADLQADYRIDIDTGDQAIYIWFPFVDFNTDIRTYLGGQVSLTGVGEETWLDGDITIFDADMTIGITGLPDWYVPMHMTSADFRILTGKNVTFFYPNSPNPFFQATIAERQPFAFTYDHRSNTFTADGQLSIRSGEIYYFQRNFFITEGSIALHTDALGVDGRTQVLPSVNLRAKMTDFDTEGNKVDIYMVLHNSRLDSFNPTFESVPSKDMNEILDLLGQSILPSGAYGQVNLYSVASLAVAATDVAERLGFIGNTVGTGTAALTETIRDSLGLDMFTLRSNIVQNVLFDALPGSGVLDSISPLARYLNNTTIFMGKYLGEDFFLQALFHLTAMDSSKVNRAFLADDLSLDMELSLEWNNPLATFSLLAQPYELSLYGFLDTIGFSVTRRIVLR